MSIAVKSTLAYPGPTVGVTLLGSNLNLANYNDVTPAIPADQQVAILSIIANYKDGAIEGEVPILIADEDDNLLFCVSAGGDSSNEYGFLYPPLLPPGKKLKVKTTTTGNEINLVIFCQYMVVPV